MRQKKYIKPLSLKFTQHRETISKKTMRTQINNLVNRINAKIDAVKQGKDVHFSETELQKIVSDPRLKSYGFFRSDPQLYNDLISKAHRTKKEDIIVKIENNHLFDKENLHYVANKYPDLAIKYLLKHGNNDDVPMENLLPAVWNLTLMRQKHYRKRERRLQEYEDAGMELDPDTVIPKVDMHQWEKIAHLKFLYREHPIDETLVHLMRKAIQMHDHKLYQHILSLGMDPLDEENEWSDYFSDKMKRQIRFIQQDQD